MRVTLEVRSGLLIGRRFDVVPGPGTVFGRSEQASGFIPHDPVIGDFHFMVQWVDGEPHILRPERDYPVWRSRLPEGYVVMDTVEIEFA